MKTIKSLKAVPMKHVILSMNLYVVISLTLQLGQAFAN